MRNRLIVVLLLATAAAFGLIFARQLVVNRNLDRTGWVDKPLRVLTYGTMVANQGPGGAIFKRFEMDNHVKLEVVVAQDVGLMLERLQAAGPFDLVIGFDQTMTEAARARFRWREITYDAADWQDVPARVSDRNFVAFDWSPLTFIYREDGQPVPRSVDELVDAKYRGAFTLEDPRLTTPGLEFVRWIAEAKGAGTRAWFARFHPNVNAVTPTWSAAYGVFERKQTRFVWTYLTSLAFHWGTQRTRDFKALQFKEGHPVQVELAAVPADCRECDLGERLLTRLLTPESQRLIMTRNFMLPVLKGIEAGTVYAELPSLGPFVTPTGKDLTEWNDVFTH